MFENQEVNNNVHFWPLFPSACQDFNPLKIPLLFSARSFTTKGRAFFQRKGSLKLEGNENLWHLWIARSVTGAMRTWLFSVLVLNAPLQIKNYQWRPWWIKSSHCYWEMLVWNSRIMVLLCLIMAFLPFRVVMLPIQIPKPEILRLKSLLVQVQNCQLRPWSIKLSR